MVGKIVSIVGATGAQGGSVLDALVNDKNYTVRAITRNPNSESAKALTTRGVQVVQADVNDLSSLTKAFKGSYAVYAITDFFEPFGNHGPEKAVEIESEQGINLAKAAAATTGLQHYIWSTLPDAAKISGGKHSIPHFVAKNNIDSYIRSQPELLAKTTFFWITFYAQNYYWPVFTPIFVPTAVKYIQVGITSPDVPIKTIGNARLNIGAFAKAALDQPEKTRNGTTVLVHVGETTVGEMLQTWAKAQGNTAEYVQVDQQTYNALWPGLAQEVALMMKFWEEAGQKSWTSTGRILTKEELGITGLVGLKESFAGLQF